jgi:hypothetical protein
MTKKAAMLMAAGLVATLAAGAMALSFGLTGNEPARADTKDQKPIVRTIRRTVTVEKPAKGAQQPVQVIQLASGPASSASAVSAPSTGGSDDGYEDDGYEDDGYEDDGYEDGADDHGGGGGEHEGEHGDAGDDD